MSDEKLPVRVELVEDGDFVFDSELKQPSADADHVMIGQWYWVPGKEWDGEKDVHFEWFACVTHIGSNYVQLEEPDSVGMGRRSCRVHADSFYEEVRYEPNHERVIQEKIQKHQRAAQQHLNEVKAITARLGVGNSARLGNAAAASTGTAVVAGAKDIKAYENALVKAKDEDLPALFKKVEKENKMVAKWMAAEALTIKASLGSLEGVIKEIGDRIFNVSLYAGLTENVVKCCDGAPAGYDEKLHVMQRRLYMDEECLANYKAGGMDFKNILEFDKWISNPENRDRLLPFKRCLVAMRVRRNTKQRAWDGSLVNLLIKFNLEQQDKLTYLYIRNGEQIHRLDCDLEFGEDIFPDKATFDPSRPMMVKMFCNRVDKMITLDEYELECAEQDRRNAVNEQWLLDNPAETWDEDKGPRSWRMPYSHHSFNRNEWGPFDQTNVFYDEIMEKVSDEIKKYNRIALIIQGLFDRSLVLHPHPPVKTWSAEGFDNAIKLIYDGSMVLHDGDAPDFETYRAKCNESITTGSLVIGQELFWMKKEAEKECKRRDNDYRERSEWRPETFRPYGNPGPGYMARIDEFKPRSGKATFNWYREKRNSSYMYRDDQIACKIIVPVSELFNVDAYKLGDFKQFFQDYRTRIQYLEWAPLLLAAEEYHAKTRTIKQINN